MEQLLGEGFRCGSIGLVQMGRAPSSSRVTTGEGLNKGPWTAEEDSILTAFVRANGEGNWRILPKRAGLKRCRKSCRLRWMNYLRPDLKRGNFSPDEDELIIKLHSLLGNKWSLIAGRIPGRTDNEIKNYWNSRLKRNLQDMEGNQRQQLVATPLSVSLLDSSTEIKVEDFPCSNQLGMSGPPSPIDEKPPMEALLGTHHHSNDLDPSTITKPQLLNSTDFHAMPRGESTLSEPTSSDGTCFEESCDHQSLEGYSSSCNWAPFDNTQKPLSFTQASSPESVLLFQQYFPSQPQDDFLCSDFGLTDFTSTNYIPEFTSLQNLLQCGPFSPIHKNLPATWIGNYSGDGFRT